MSRSLVYHTYLPKIRVGGTMDEGNMDVAPPLLAEYAPILLRSLYERDVRWEPLPESSCRLDRVILHKFG
jgi:hypothetical protein